MSRYKKAQRNEFELPEIDGITPILRPTRDEIFQAVDIFKNQQISKNADLVVIRKYLTDLLYNSLFLWEGFKRTEKREEGSEDITKEDIDDFVVRNIFSVWSEVLFATKIIDKDVLEKLKQEEKKKKKEAKNDPN